MRSAADRKGQQIVFDVCVIGHLTKDIVQTGDREKELPGGTAYYSGVALRKLGMSVAVVTKLNRRDISLVKQLEREDVRVFWARSDRTTTFRNVNKEGSDDREQWVRAVADPFSHSDVAGVEAKIFHLGPLTQEEISPEEIQYLAEKAVVSLDVQGFVRKVEETDRDWAAVRQVQWNEKEKVLPYVNVLKANEEEARFLSQEHDLERIAADLSRRGPEEVLITCGGDGSLLYAGGRPHWIPAYPPKRKVDPTGAGDTYMAAYLYYRNKTTCLDEAAKFAAMASSLKLEHYGPFCGGEEDVRAFAARSESTPCV
jgi:sugar/nucleoside kinase (ribokinase family)